MEARKIIINLSLLLASCLFSVLLCELALRNFYPKYQGVAEAQYDRDPILIWSRLKNSRGWFRHPDSGSYHPYHHNNLRMRQHRDFSEVDLESPTNMGFFGDSFLENQGMKAQYSLTEPLDYLLNLSYKRFNTLNFGISGYGTGQSFLRYENFPYAQNLEYVFYVFTDNDLQNIYENGLFYLDDVGELARNEAIRSSWWVRLVSRLHISYLFLDVGQRVPFVVREIFANLEEYFFREKSLQRLKMEQREKFQSPIANGIVRDFKDGMLNNEHIDNAVVIFRHLIHHWKDLVEERGGKFYIVLLPRLSESRLTTILDDEFEVIDLYECFGDYVKDYQRWEWDSLPYRFKRDNHWNEAGNQLAVVCLYRFLEQKLDLPVLSDDALQKAFYRYYSSFEGWMPDETWVKAVPVPPHVRDSIRDKYLALEKLHPGTD